MDIDYREKYEKAQRKAKIKKMNGMDTSKEESDMLANGLAYMFDTDDPVIVHAVNEYFEKGLDHPDIRAKIEAAERRIDEEGGAEMLEKYETLGIDGARKSLLDELDGITEDVTFEDYMEYVPRFIKAGPNDEYLLNILEQRKKQWIKKHEGQQC